MTEHSNKDFQWTDELVKDFVRERIIAPCDYLHTQLDDRVDSFKIEHTNTYTSKDNLVSGSNVAGNEKDFEIVKYILADGRLAHPSRYDYINDSSKINSVKRLSDGEVFSIGDETNYGIIEKFFIGWAGMEVHFTNGCGATLASIEKNKKPEALFKDYLGNDVYEGNDYWVVLEPDWKWEIVKRLAVKKGLNNDRPNLFYFSTELSAHQYVSENKPQFSIKDFKDILIRYDYAIDMMEDVFTDLKYFGKLNDKK